MTKNKNQEPYWYKAGRATAQFLFGASLLGLAIFGWRCWEFYPIIAIVLGLSGIATCGYALGLKSDSDLI